MPLGAFVRGRAFSSAEWGAWSVAMTSMVPSFNPARMPFTSWLVRRGGLTRAIEPWVRISSSVSQKYWGQVSQVRWMPFFFILRMMSTLRAVDTWQMWTWAPVSSASMASRMTTSSSAIAGRPSSHSWRDTLPSFTARPSTIEVSSQWHSTGISRRRARISTSRIRLALSTLQPSSDRAMAPAFFRASASVGSSPRSPMDTAPMG